MCKCNLYVGYLYIHPYSKLYLYYENILKLEMKVMLLWKCYIEDLAVDISLVEVVPFLLVPSLPWEHAEMGTTSAIRNSQLNPHVT